MTIVETFYDIGDLDDMIDASGAGKGTGTGSSVGGAAGEDHESYVRQVLDEIETGMEIDGETLIPELAGHLAVEATSRHDSAAAHAAKIAQLGEPISLDRLADQYGGSAIFN